MPPSFPFTSVDSISAWFNFHHTITNRQVPLYLTPDGLGVTSPTPTPSSWVRQAQALNAIIDHARKATPPERLTTLGATWSLSNVLDPANMVIDQGAFNTVIQVDRANLTAEYLTDAAPRGGVPVIAQGGTQMGKLNDLLGRAGFALQTSGANDGHRLAGCIATGTHGSALEIGAVHDTVLAVLLVTDVGQAVLVQPSRRRFTPALAAWFARATTFAVADRCDDDQFHAAQVALGSLGFVHSVILEAVPLYQLITTVSARPLYDVDVWHAIETLDTSRLDPADATPPYHFSLVLSPYAQGTEQGAFPILMRKRPPVDPYAPPDPINASIASDTSRLLSAFIGVVDSSLAAPVLRHLLVSLTAGQFTPGTQRPMFPGQVFGPTSLPPGNGRSTEIVVDHQVAVPALTAVLGALQAEAAQGRHLLGALGVRFVKQTEALLGMNLHPMNCYIEVPSLGSPHIDRIQRAVWGALWAANIDFTCHWGQEYGMDNASLGRYFGGRLGRWRTARDQLLTTPEARAVFRTPILSSVGIL